MTIFDTWLHSDLQRPLTVTLLPGVMFTGDDLANRINVRVHDGGRAAGLAGTVTAYLIRSDESTLIITGSLAGDTVSIVLPETAYAHPGPLDIVIKVADGSSVTTVGACRAYVARSSTDTIADPDHVIPSLDELLAMVERLEADMALVEGMTASAHGLDTQQPPTVTVSKTGGHYNLDFGIPKGDTGIGGVTSVNGYTPDAQGKVTIPAATDSADGLLSAGDKGKLNDLSYPLPANKGGTGLTSSPSLLVDLGSTTAANILTASPRPGVTGTLGVAHGGTGASTLASGQALIGNGTGAVQTRAITNITSGAATASTNLVTANTLVSHVNDKLGSYLPLTGGTMTGSILGNQSNALGTAANPFHNIVLGGAITNVMTAASTNPRITFQEATGTQPVHLIYTDHDSYRAPAGLKIVGGDSASPAWFEVEGQVYAAGFNGPLTGNAATATGVRDAGDTSKTLTIRYQGSGVSATDWLPFYDGSGNLVPVSSTNLANKVRDKSSGTWGINITGNAATASAVAWANVTSKPTTATRWPSWDEVTGKPSLSYIPLITNAGLGEVSGGGSNNYFLLATLTIVNGYVNRPVVFEVSRRGYGFQRLQIIFRSENSIDPDLQSFSTDGNTLGFWIVKQATSTWVIYGQYNEPWGFCTVHRITGSASNNGVNVALNLTNAGTAAPGGTAISRFWSASYADGAGSVGGYTPATIGRWKSVASTASGAWATAVAGAQAGWGEIMISAMLGSAVVLHIYILAAELTSSVRNFTSAAYYSISAGGEYRYRVNAAASLTAITLSPKTALSGTGDYGVEGDQGSGYTYTYYYR